MRESTCKTRLQNPARFRTRKRAVMNPFDPVSLAAYHGLPQSQDVPCTPNLQTQSWQFVASLTHLQ